MTHKRALLPLYAIVAIFVLAINSSALAMNDAGKVGGEKPVVAPAPAPAPAPVDPIVPAPAPAPAPAPVDPIVPAPAPAPVAPAPQPAPAQPVKPAKQDEKNEKKEDGEKRKNGQYKFDFKNLYNSPRKKLALAFLAAFAHLVCKDEPAANPMGVKDGFKGFVTKNPFSKEYLQHIAHFVDEVVIGYAGKKRGFRVLGSRIGYEGQPQSVAAIKQQVMNGAEEVTLYKYGNALPYGLMGTVWAYALGITKGLKDLKDGAEATQWAHDVVVNNFGNDNTPTA